MTSLTMQSARELVAQHTEEISSYPLCPSPVVTVCVITYRHARYIRQAIESALAQETDFDVEIVIGDDGSDDGTVEILKELQEQHPRQIRLLLARENLGKHTGNGRLNMLRTLWAARGHYLALLEGDDYWTDPTKLQRQVTALRAHPNWSLCFHVAEHVDANGIPIGIVHPLSSPAVVTIEDMLTRNYVQTCSILARSSIISKLPEAFLTYPVGDWPFCIIAAREGGLGFLDRTMCAYRVHEMGYWAGKSEDLRHRKTIEMHFQLMEDFPALRPGCQQYILSYIEDLQNETAYIKSSWFFKIFRTLRSGVQLMRSARPASSILRGSWLKFSAILARYRRWLSSQR